MAEELDPAVVDYVRATRPRYTREAITKRLLEMGRSAAEIERAWDVVEAEGPVQAAGDWRPGWIAWLVLVGLGAIGAFLVWRDDSYGAPAIAPVVYIGAASLAFALGKAGSIFVDEDQRLGVAIGGGLVVAGLTYVSIASGPGTFNVVVLIGALMVGVATLTLASADARVAGFAGAALPIIGWLLVTGVCYSPLIGA
jgi:hypothetical protein